MENQILLISQNATALHPFPCPTHIEKYGKPTEQGCKSVFSIFCGDTKMADYTSIVPAKMEIERLRTAWRNGEDREFRFVKEE